MIDLGLSLASLPVIGLHNGSVPAVATPQTIFGDSLRLWLDPQDLSSMAQDSAGTTPAAVDSPVGLVTDKSANAYEATASGTARPTLRQAATGMYYLECDGTDDMLAIADFDMSDTSQVAVFAAVRKLTDSVNDAIVWHGNTGNTAGTWALTGPTSTSSYRFGSRGPSGVGNADATGFAAPHTAVLTGIGDLVNDVSILRVNGQEEASATDDQGGGTYSLLDLDIAGFSSLIFTGHVYGIVVVDTVPTSDQITAMEAYFSGLVPSIRIVPNGDYGAYVIAPHDDLGAIAYELTYQNGGDTSTPGSSIGTPFGGWRWTGTHQLDAVTDDPTSPVGTLHDDIGSTDSAMQANFGSSLFGGHYHGGIVLSSSQVPDLTSERYVSAFNFGYEATITWPTGETASVTFDMAIQPDGNLAGSISYTSAAAFTRVFLSMVIASGFDQYSTDGETFSDASGAGNYSLGASTGVILRQGSTGYQITVSTEQGGITNVTNEVNSSGARLKHYVRKTSAGGALGSVTMARAIAFTKTDPDPEPPPDLFHWIGAEDGATWSEVPASAAVYLDGGDLVMERGTDTGVAYHRAIFAMTGLTENTSYRLPVDAATVGSASAGCWLDIIPSSSGSTSNSVASEFMGDVIAAGYIDFTTGAGQTTLYAMARQSPDAGAGSGDVLRVSELGPLVVVP